MPNLLTTALTSVGLATLIAGSAWATEITDSTNFQAVSAKAADRDTMERDAAQSPLRRGGVGVVISRGDNSLASVQANQSVSTLQADERKDAQED